MHKKENAMISKHNIRISIPVLLRAFSIYEKSRNIFPDKKQNRIENFDEYQHEDIKNFLEDDSFYENRSNSPV